MKIDEYRTINAKKSKRDFHDYINYFLSLKARIITKSWYSFFFKEIGTRSWIKPLAQLHTPSRISIGSGVRVEKNCTLYAVKKSGNIEYEGEISISDGTFINENCNITAAHGIKIGENVAFGPNVFVCDFDHDYEMIEVNRLETPLRSKGPIKIGDRCWIGINACITSGVILGHDCVVGANSVVTSSFPPYTVIAGIPARAIKRYDFSSNQWVRISEAESTNEC